MKTEDYISRRAFSAKYHTISSELYRQFCEKIAASLEPTLDKGISVESLGFRSRWKDAGCNIHCSLNGQVRRLDESGEVRGEMVLLKNSNTFRGWAKHDLKTIEDWQWLQRAREEFKQRHYAKCLTLLSLLKDRAILTPANHKMAIIAARRASNQPLEASGVLPAPQR
jgi:hypothetical protein